MLSLGIGLTSVPVLARRGPAYDPDALAFFARLTNPPTDARKKLYSDLIASLKTADVWPDLAVLQVMAAADAQAARQNLVASAYSLTASGSPAFVADRGYAGDSVAAHLLGPSMAEVAAMPKFSLDNATVVVGVETAGVSTGALFGQSSGAARFAGNPRPANNVAFCATNSSNVASLANSNRAGYIAGHVIDATTQAISINGGARVTGARGTAALPQGPISLLRHLTAYSDDRIKVFAMAALLTPTKENALITSLNTFTAAVGAA